MKILTALALVATALSTFVAGRATSQPTQPENLTRLEMTVESGGLYLSYTDDQDRFYDFWIPYRDLESVGLINVNSVKGWETWESADEVGLEICGYEITKAPYTVNTTVEKID